MKHLLACILLLASLSACAGGSSFGKPNCSNDGEVCIEVRAEEPISIGKPVKILITVTSPKEIPELGVSISIYPITIKIEELEKWGFEASNKIVWEGGAGWTTSSKPYESLKFNLNIYPPIDISRIKVIADVNTSQVRASDSLTIYLTQEGGKVYLSGTEIPITPGPLPTPDAFMRATINAIPTATPWPTMIPVYETLKALPTETPTSPGSAPLGTPYP